MPFLKKKTKQKKEEYEKHTEEKILIQTTVFYYLQMLQNTCNLLQHAFGEFSPLQREEQNLYGLLFSSIRC